MFETFFPHFSISFRYFHYTAQKGYITSMIVSEMSEDRLYLQTKDMVGFKRIGFF